MDTPNSSVNPSANASGTPPAAGQAAPATPPAQGGGTSASASEAKVVPIQALHEERDRRQALESKVTE